MSNYQVQTASATVGLVAAGVIMISTAFVDFKGQDGSMDRMRPMPTSTLSNVAVYMEGTKSSTLGLSYEVTAVPADQLLHQASLNFAASLAIGMEVLGSDYLATIEDNFWDLVLR